jgi:putative transposase
MYFAVLYEQPYQPPQPIHGLPWLPKSLLLFFFRLYSRRVCFQSHKRFSFWFIMYIKTRVIVHFRTTTNPTKLFVEQQLMHVTYDMVENEERMRLIHDNSPQFKLIWYEPYNIDNVPISVMTPNMNSYAERFVRSIRKECLDWFILFNAKQIKNLLSEYISYYNSKRSHQGIDYKILKGYIPQTKGIVVSKPVLFGLIHHYERLAA